MRNRAKCNLCNSIIESFHRYDYVSCKCGEISITGGLEVYETAAKDYANFLRVDDENNEIIVKIKEAETIDVPKEETKVISKKEMLDMLDEMIKSIERLPQHAMTTPITHYDHLSLILLLSSILHQDNIEGDDQWTSTIKGANGKECVILSISTKKRIRDLEDRVSFLEQIVNKNGYLERELGF